MTHVRLKPRVPHGASTHLADGVVSETTDAGELVTFTFTDLDVSTVDQTIAALEDLMRRCDDAGRPLHVLLDLSQPDLILTPYARDQMAALTRTRPRLRGRVALFAQAGTSIAHRIDRVLRSELYHYRERSLFFDREQALAWLRETPEQRPLS